MRQIATLPPDRAELLADHLLTLRIDTHLEREAQGVTVWVRDEDKVAAARTEALALEHNPVDPRFAGAKRRAGDIRRDLAREEAEAIEADEESRPSEESPPPDAQRPVTLALAVACVLVFLQSSQGDARERGYDPGRLYAALQINSPETAATGIFVDVRAGQFWRLFTPALLHYGWDHIIMNVLALLFFGALVETRTGPVRMFLLVLALAVASNSAEYLLGHLRWNEKGLLVVPFINFGGMSGVLFGLLGYLWVKGGRDPSGGPVIPPPVLIMSLFWLVLCWTGVMGPVANVAHTSGLLAGLALGWLPSPPLQTVAGPTPKDEAP